MNDDFKPIPYSAGRYLITRTGQICDKEGNFLKTQFTENAYRVRLDWICGRAEYSIGLLVIMTFTRFNIPLDKVADVDVLYVDGNPKNTAFGNLLYRFKNGPIESEKFPGFFHIPFYTGYVISKEGVLLNAVNGKKKTWSITKPPTENKKNVTEGYFYSRCISDLDISRILLRHRALCFTFKEYDRHVGSMLVNHRNGIPGDDRLENLEWCTALENIEHAVVSGLRSDNKPVLALHYFTGEEHYFASKAKCGKFLTIKIADGFDKLGSVEERLKKEFTLYLDGWLVKYATDSRPWPAKGTLTQKNNRRGANVYAKDTTTGEVFLFSTCVQASEFTGVAHSQVARCARESSNSLSKGKWLFRYRQYDAEPIW